MKTVEYFTPVIIVGDSRFDVSVLELLPKEWPIYAVDGGANVLSKNKIKFEGVIGDLDSVNNKVYQINTKIIKFEDQDTTDFQKCLKYIKTQYLVGFGFLDRRIDHTLATLNSLCGFHYASKIILYGLHDIVVWSDSSWGCSLPKYSRISIWPLSKQKFKLSKGLKWPLDNLEMQPGRLIGTSNEASKEEIFIEIEKNQKPKFVTIISNKNFLKVLEIIDK